MEDFFDDTYLMNGSPAESIVRGAFALNVFVW